MFSKDFISFIAKSPTKFHAVDTVKKELEKLGYVALTFSNSWNIVSHGKYYVEQDNSAIIAFELNSVDLQSCLKEGVKLVCAHTDSPGFKVKPMAEMVSKDGYLRLNTQAYAWPLLTTWFDRPLSIAGRVAIKGRSHMRPVMKLVDIKEPIMLIPNVAFHLTKNKTDSNISKQKEMMPILGINNEGEINTAFLNRLIAKNLDIKEDDILDSELFLYPVEEGRVVGLNSDFIVSSRQDDLLMVFAAMHGLVSSTGKYSEGIKMIALFDAEEETNSTLGGADSPLLRNVLAKLIATLGGDEENLIALINKSFAISLDTAFAVHPNYVESSDPTCSPIINRGIAIKYDANMHYATTAYSSAVFQSICKANGIPYQKVAANSDLRTGGTISAFMQTQLQMNCVDVGIASWATHSAYECCGSQDLESLIAALIAFWIK